MIKTNPIRISIYEIHPDKNLKLFLRNTPSNQQKRRKEEVTPVTEHLELVKRAKSEDEGGIYSVNGVAVGLYV